MSNLVKRLNDTLPSISTPMMEGDNLAIVLCTAFDDGRGETADDTGWSIAARNGYEEVIAAIRNHYKPAADTIAALTARVEELEGAVNKSRSRIASLISDNEGLRRETQEYARQIIDLEEEVKQLKTGLEVAESRAITQETRDE